MLSFETESYLANEGQGGDALAVQDDMLATFDGMSSVDAKGADTRDTFMDLMEKGNTIEGTIRRLIEEQRHHATIAVARLVPEDLLEIYRIGDSRVRVHDEIGRLVYETPDQNFREEIKTGLGLVRAFFDRSDAEILRDILEQEEVRDKFIVICRDYLLEKGGNLFSAKAVREVLENLSYSEMVEECLKEVKKMGYSPTMLRILFTNSIYLLSHSLSTPESLAYAKPIKTMTVKPGYRIIVGTDGIFENLREHIIQGLVGQKSLRMASRGLALEAGRRNKRRVDMANAVGKVGVA